MKNGSIVCIYKRLQRTHFTFYLTLVIAEEFIVLSQKSKGKRLNQKVLYGLQLEGM